MPIEVSYPAGRAGRLATDRPTPAWARVYGHRYGGGVVPVGDGDTALRSMTRLYDRIMASGVHPFRVETVNPGLSEMLRRDISSRSPELTFGELESATAFARPGPDQMSPPWAAMWARTAAAVVGPIGRLSPGRATRRSSIWSRVNEQSRAVAVSMP